MAATIGMVFTASSAALAVIVGSGAPDGVDRTYVSGMWRGALALASLCLLAAVGGVAAVHLMRFHRRAEALPRPTGRPQTT